MNYKNLISNYSAAFLGVVAPIATMPIILNIMGIRLWGLISIMMVLQMMVGILDAGLSQVMTREIAFKYTSENRADENFDAFYYSYFNLYAIIAIVLLIMGFSISENLVLAFFNIPNDLIYEAKLTGYAAFIVSSLQLASSMPRSLLTATERHLPLAIGSITSVLCKTLLSCIILKQTPSFEYLIICYCIAALLEALIKWYFAADILKRPHLYQISRNELVKHGGVAMILTLSVGISLISGQMDKIFVAHFLQLEDLATYNIAATISMGALHAYYPLMMTISPNFYNNAAEENLKSTALKTIFLLVKLVSLAWILYIFGGEFVIHIWLDNENLSKKVFQLATILLLGVSVNSIYNVFYTVLISSRNIKSIFKINALAFVFILIAAPVLINSFGMWGAAVAWSATQLVMLSVGFVYAWIHVKWKI